MVNHFKDNEIISAFKSKVVQLYNDGIYSTDLSRQTGINSQTIINWVRNSGGKVRHQGVKSKVGREDYFDIIDSEHKAYYLGWIMADGNVSVYNQQYALKIAISSIDRDILIRFLDDIEATYRISYTADKYGHNRCYVSISSKHMVLSLMKYGVIPRKSGHESFPSISKELEHHFIRGYFDGDGITCIKKNKRSGFIANNLMLQSIQERIGSNLTISKGHNTIGMNIILGGIGFSRELYDYMYHDATVWIKRKRDRMDIICGNAEISNSNNSELPS